MQNKIQEETTEIDQKEWRHSLPSPLHRPQNRFQQRRNISRREELLEKINHRRTGDSEIGRR